MANVSKIVANGKLFTNKDSEARLSIEDLKESKQETLSVKEPLILQNNKLSIDLYNYYTKSENDNNYQKSKNELSQKIENNTLQINEIKTKILSILADKINAEFRDLGTLPNISNYEETIKDIKRRLLTVETENTKEVESLKNKLEEADASTTKKIEKLGTELNEKIDLINNRTVEIEREIFGEIYEEDSLSRIDILENKLNDIHDTLIKIGLIKS